MAVTDAGGNPIGINAYDEYGVPQGGSITGKFGYTGQLWLPEVGLYDYKARMYNPDGPGFMQPDPAGPVDSPNPYQAMLNNPVNLVDPLGLAAATLPPPPPPQTIVVTACRDMNAVLEPNPSAPTGYVCISPTNVSENQVNPGGSFGPAIGTPQAPTTPVQPPQQGQQNQCPSGARVTASFGPSGTLFGGIVGVSGSLQGTVSVPVSSLMHGSLAGIQFSGSLSGTILGGFGVFASFGGWNAGYASGALQPGRSSSIQTVFQVGAGDGGGVEMSTEGLGSPNNSLGGSVGARGAIGVFGAFGKKFSKTVATPPLGC